MRKDYDTIAENYWNRVARLGNAVKEELTISSMEVAEMVTGKEHKNLLRDIRTY